MITKTEWNDEPDLRDEVYQALEDAGLDVAGSDEQGEHGERGTIEIWVGDERYTLQLWKHRRY